MTRPLRIGTRGSRLALWQANHVADSLRPISDRPIELVEIQTAGDQIRDVPLSAFGGQGAFTKEIQKALIADAVDLAVHSLKDLPTVTIPGLILAAVPPRGPTGDVFVSHCHLRFDELPLNAVLATSSLRRGAQALHRRPDLQIVNVRGNVETRLGKLQTEALDGIILAQAGLERLGLARVITEIIDPQWMLPAVGQGALGLECRTNDLETRSVVEKLNDPRTYFEVLAEREFLRALNGGCQVPIGAICQSKDATLWLRGAVLSPDGTKRIEGNANGTIEQAEAIGRKLAEDLLSQRAGELLI